MSAETRFCALSVLELDNWRVLYRLLPDPEHPRRHLRNHMIPIRNNSIRITALTSRHESIQPLRSPRPRQHEIETNRSKRHTSTINRQRNPDLFPAFSLVQEIERSIFSGSTFAKPLFFHPRTSKPPPESPILYSRPFFGKSPVNAIS